MPSSCSCCPPAKRELLELPSQMRAMPAVARLFRSPLGLRLRDAAEVRREFRFQLLCPAADYFPAAAPGDEILLQGVVDCCFAEPDGSLTIVDYKTDRVAASDVPARAAHYRGQLLAYARETCRIYNSAEMTLEQVIETIRLAESEGKMTVRLHTGDSSIYGAVREQFDELERLGIAYDVCPGVSSFCGAAASLKAEYTLPDVSQTVIITREAGKTPVPDRESLDQGSETGCASIYSPFAFR